MNKKIAPLQFITPDLADKNQLEKLVYDVCKNGCRWVQLRLKKCSDNDFLEIGKSIRRITETFKASLIVNDRVHLVEKIKADGVHIGKNDMPVLEARKIIGSNKIIGATANTLNDCLQHINNKVDYIGLGPYRFTNTKKNLSPVLGIDGYKTILEQLPKNHLPIIAIGGIQLEDLKLLLEVGLSGIAVSSSLSKNPNEIKSWLKEIEDFHN